MNRMGKPLSLWMVPLAISLLLIGASMAQAVSTPSVPQFTLKLVDYMEGGGLETQIQNQPIIPNGHDTAGIFLDCRFKWHESTNWYHPEPDPTKWERQYLSEIGTTGVTTMVGSPYVYYDILGSTTTQQLDVQYRAINGYLNIGYTSQLPMNQEPGDFPVIVVNTSEWSNTVTITLPDNKPQTSTTTATATINPTELPSTQPTETTPTSSPTFTQTIIPVSSNDFMVAITIVIGIIFAVLIIVVLFLILIYKRIQKIK